MECMCGVIVGYPRESMYGLIKKNIVSFSLGMNSSMFGDCSVFCDVRHVQSSILGPNVMFGKFNVHTFNVRSVQSLVFWCLFQD